MQVVFKRNWFGPNGVRYRSRNGEQPVPDDLEDQLPSDAVVIGKPHVAKPPEVKPHEGFKPSTEPSKK